MSVFDIEMLGDVAVLRLDCGGVNTLSRAVLEDLGGRVEALSRAHKKKPLAGVILTGNRAGFGVGANLPELSRFSADELRSLINLGHEILFRIERSPFPWLTLVEGYCLGGMYEIALACRGIIAKAGATIGLPEAKLNIIPGLGGTQRLPRRALLVHPATPTKKPGALSAILEGTMFSAVEAAEIGMIDRVVPDGADPLSFTREFLRGQPRMIRRFETDSLSLSQIMRITRMTLKNKLGERGPRAPFIALEVIEQGLSLPLSDALNLERDRFIETATSHEGRAGIRHFLTTQVVERLPRAFREAGVRPVKTIGIAGIDGYMGNAIAWLAFRAGYTVVGWVPSADLAKQAQQGFREKYDWLIKNRGLDPVAADKAVKSVTITPEITAIGPCDLVIEALKEDPEVKATFFRELGGVAKPTTIVASNSSSMGPGLISQFFAQGGGRVANVVNLHFFGPAEHPSRALVEIIRTEHTALDVLATVHGVVRKMRKTPVILEDGSIGFLVNAALTAYVLEAEKLYREGTPIEKIDQTLVEFGFPMGPFEVLDFSGLDTCAGMLKMMVEERPEVAHSLVIALVEGGKLGRKSGSGFYLWMNGKKSAPAAGLSQLCEPMRGGRIASREEIIERCVGAMTARVRELVSRHIVVSAEQADLALVLGIGFPHHLGGPIFNAERVASATEGAVV